MRLIDVDTLTRDLKENWYTNLMQSCYVKDEEYTKNLEQIILDIITPILIDQPIFEIDDPLIARWVGNKCKVCGYPIATDTIKFCPMCGANMDEEE